MKYACRQIRVSAHASSRWTSVTIEDDGPGIESRQIAEVLLRGKRLDETTAGDGLGLAIARELVEATSGQMQLGGSGLGGLKIELHWGED